MLLGNAHTHSTLSDGRESPRRMIREYKNHGYDFVIMTDHAMRKSHTIIQMSRES